MAKDGLTIGGVRVVLPWSSLVGVGVLTWLFAPGFTDAGESRSSGLLLAGIFALLTYASILVHELAHAAAARRFGFPVIEIRLYALGGYTTYERRVASPGRELAIALAGPAATLALAAACWALGRVAVPSLGRDAPVSELLVQLTYVGLLLGVYNLLPGLPLDGGALVKSPVWKLTGSELAGTRVAAYAGLVVAVVVFTLPFALASRAGMDGPELPTIVLVALFSGWLAMGALDALRRARVESRLDGITAGGLARPAVFVAPDLPVARALEQVGGSGGRLVVSDTLGRPIAIGDAAAMAAVPEQRRPWVTCASVSRSLAPDHVIDASLQGHALLAHLAAHPSVDYLVVGSGGTVLGVLSVGDVESALTGS